LIFACPSFKLLLLIGEKICMLCASSVLPSVIWTVREKSCGLAKVKSTPHFGPKITFLLLYFYYPRSAENAQNVCRFFFAPKHISVLCGDDRCVGRIFKSVRIVFDARVLSSIELSQSVEATARR
jgi:hypothetical protein